MTNQCSIDGCSKPQKARGLCSAHWSRQHRHGDPNGGGTAMGALQAWVETHKSFKGDECLMWPFKSNVRGYGTFSLPLQKGRKLLVHRFMCEARNGPPPTPKHHAAHSCGNGHLGCANPGHVVWKTPKENQGDRLTHGTHNRGENSGHAKLTREQVLEIKVSHLPQRALAKTFNVGQSTISLIRTGKNWGWLW